MNMFTFIAAARRGDPRNKCSRRCKSGWLGLRTWERKVTSRTPAIRSSAPASWSKGKQKTVIDGPFAEAKDLIGGFTLIEARDLDHAVELAKGCPIFEFEGGGGSAAHPKA